jgi:hypothetical protein
VVVVVVVVFVVFVVFGTQLSLGPHLIACVLFFERKVG